MSWQERTWALGDLPYALAALARSSGLAKTPSMPAHVPAITEGRLDETLVEVARAMNLSAQPVEARFDEVERLVSCAAPVVLRVTVDGEARLLLIGRRGRKAVSVVRPDLSIERVSRDLICQQLRAPFEAALPPTIENVLAYATSERTRIRTRQAIITRAYGDDPRVSVRGCWMLRLATSATLRNELRRSRILQLSILFIMVALLSYVLEVVGWRFLGDGALRGHFDTSWLGAWALILLTWLVVAGVSLVILGRLVLAFRIVLRRRLLEGAFKLRPDEIRHEGVGQLIGRIIDTEEFQQLGLNNAIPALIALVAALLVLGLGANGGLMVMLLVGWLVLILLLGKRLYTLTLKWTEERLTITNHLVEMMAGHRTRLAQLPKSRWHEREEGFLQSYLAAYQQRDRLITVLRGVAVRGWILIAGLGLAPGIVEASYSPVEIAIAIGGVIVAQQSLTQVIFSVEHFANIVVAWKTSGHLLRAAERPEDAAPARILPLAPDVDLQESVLQASGLSFGHRPGHRVLRDCTVDVARGDRILLEGPSGGGKSTFARLLAGLHQQHSGLLLADGYDRGTTGLTNWRRYVALTPQFHENHVFHGQLAFNLLLGRAWPATADDLREADEICHELGLGPLLAKMPAGLKQIVGDTGWQLSHGERSRLYIARALMQKAKVLVFDESFAALDPETLATCLECVVRRAPTLIVVAHP